VTRRPVLKAVDHKRAMSLWRRYKTDTVEYKKLAESACVNTAELNAYCSEFERMARQKKEREAQEAENAQSRGRR
jgi:hypothetical protein